MGQPSTKPCSLPPSPLSVCLGLWVMGDGVQLFMTLLELRALEHRVVVVKAWAEPALLLTSYQ